jgi:hypothetical protein
MNFICTCLGTIFLYFGRMYRPLLWIVISVFVSVFVLCKESKPGIPEATILSKIQGQEIQINIGIPSNHHAYLDSGDEGVLLPIEFDWASFKEKPVLKAAPGGVRDETAKAMVLRDIGQFLFESKESASGKNIRVRIQICDDVKGLCYPPRFSEVTL